MVGVNVKDDTSTFILLASYQSEFVMNEKQNNLLTIYVKLITLILQLKKSHQQKKNHKFRQLPVN